MADEENVEVEATRLERGDEDELAFDFDAAVEVERGEDSRTLRSEDCPPPLDDEGNGGDEEPALVGKGGCER